MEPVTDVHLFITHKCNLNCVHCLIVDKKDKELQADDFKEVIDDFIELGCTHLDVTGGETTTKKGFLDIVDYAQSKDLSVGLATNGTNWQEEDVERLLGLNPEKVNISIYSADSLTHDTITQKAGSFAKSVKFAQRLIETGIQVNFKCMVMGRNFESFSTVEQLARDVGAGYQFDAHITAKVDGDISPLKERLSDDQLWKFVNSPFCAPPRTKTATSDTIVCTAGVDRAAINAYGDVFPCAAFPISIGNIKEKKLSEIWYESEILNEIRALRFKDMGRCGTCPLLNVCSPCPGASYLEQGDFKLSPDWSCKVANMIAQKQKGGE